MMPNLFYITTFILLMFLSTEPRADTQDSYKNEIKKISQQIKKISDELNSSKRLLKNEQDKMFEVERRIKDTNKNLEQTRQSISRQIAKIESLKEQEKLLNQKNEGNKSALSELVLSQYKRGKSHYLKTLLNQQSPYALGRLNNYYGYYYQAYSEKMAVINEQIEQVIQLQTTLQLEIAELKNQQRKEQQQQQLLKQDKEERTALLTKLNQKVDTSGTALKKLQEDKERLNNLLKEIALQAEKLRIERERQRQLETEREQKLRKEQELASKEIIPRKSTIVQGGFSKQKGRLSLPVAGKIKHQYNSRIAESGMRSDGILIETGTSKQVTAVFEGDVVFADWLKGYGLLLIIDHGDDHLSLYGHNDVLYKKAGDHVASNELIATTGITGGLTKPALYFEIRKNALPVDPNLWCK